MEGPARASDLTAEAIARPEDLYTRIGFGKADARSLLARVVGDEKLPEPAEPGRLRQAVSKILPFRDGPIAVKGHGDLLAYLAKCCNPLPGEEIVGYVTRGRGVSVHSMDCPNVKNLMYNPEREIDVEWARGKDDVYQISLLIETEDQPGMLARLTEVIAKADSNITQIEAETNEAGPARIGVICQLRDRKHLEKLLRAVRSIPGVLTVHRRMSGGETVAEALS
jgi:GTP pyrophosphokinase